MTDFKLEPPLSKAKIRIVMLVFYYEFKLCFDPVRSCILISEILLYENADFSENGDGDENNAWRHYLRRWWWATGTVLTSVGSVSLPGCS